MIQHQTFLKVSDNSGAKVVKCIKILGGLKKKYATVGDIIVVSIQQLRNKSKKTSKVKKKEIYQALIIKTKKWIWKKNGFYKKFVENSVVLLNKQSNPIGSRIIAGISKDLERKKFQKFISISLGLI